MAASSFDKAKQALIVSSLVTSQFLFAMCEDELDESYFTDIPCKVLYKTISVFYGRYGKVPNKSECLVELEKCWTPLVGSTLADVQETCDRIYAMEEPDEVFIKDVITDFIRKARSAHELRRFVTKAKENPSFDSEEIVSDLAKALDVQLSGTRAFDMRDLSQVKAARIASVGGEDSSKIIPSSLETLNSYLMYGGWQPSTINMVVAPPGTGKSMFLIKEGVNASKQGYSVLHIFIGDMQDYDGFIRYISSISGIPQNTLIMMNLEKQQSVIEMCNQQYDNVLDRIRILSYPSMSLTVEKLIDNIFQTEKSEKIDFDMIVIDYPDNLIQDGKSLYEDGGTLYSSLEKLSRLSKAVVLVASQPKQCYWQHEILPLEAAAESSKKQMAVDVVLGMNKITRVSEAGSFHLAKARKGQVGKIWRFKTDFARCQLEEIDESVYSAMKAAALQA